MEHWADFFRNRVCLVAARMFYCRTAATGHVDLRAVYLIMTTIESNGNAVQQKTRELCETILTEPNVLAIRQRIDTFMADAKARGQYEAVISKGQALQEKQQRYLPLSGEEIS